MVWGGSVLYVLGVLVGRMILVRHLSGSVGDILAQTLSACFAKGKGQPQAGVCGVRLEEG